MTLINKTWKAYLFGGSAGMIFVLFTAFVTLTPEISAESYMQVNRMVQQSPQVAVYVKDIMEKDGKISRWQFLLAAKILKEEKMQTAREELKKSTSTPSVKGSGEKPK